MAVRLVFQIVLLLWPLNYASALATLNFTKDGCKNHCGGVSIPFPFGIGANCSVDDWFQIVCNESLASPKPLLKSFNLEVLNISIATGTVRVNYPILSVCNNVSTSRENVELAKSPFFFSSARNYVVVVGSDCNNNRVSVADKYCEPGNNYDGLCCRTRLLSDLDAFTTTIEPRSNIADTLVRGCMHAFLVDSDSWKRWVYGRFINELGQITNVSVPVLAVPVVLEWGIPSPSFTSLPISKDSDGKNMKYNSTYRCYFHSSFGSITFTCECEYGYEGNPYLPDRCQDINECERSIRTCGHDGLCINVPGSSFCYQTSRSQQIRAIAIGISTSFGVLFLLFGGWWSYKLIRKRKMIKQKEKFFKRNGGLLLQQQLSSSDYNVDGNKLFSSKDLEEATDRFNVNRILGKGGQGTVYKGMLSDGRIVAVKRSVLIDEEKLEEFINEVVILSRINHRNVVKLLGCCLETEVPLLVYEFIPNGTLAQYLDNQTEEFPPTWGKRLQIATEVAGALFYLHSAATSPIYHRDIKTTNILLDEKYRAKVADFGTSRSVAIDQTHLTTLVHGTFGYLDPEYFQSSQYTEKSDVYSFGVVLAELLTGEKAISSKRTQETKSLATHFINSMEENNLFDILDSRVLKEAKKEEIIAVANLVKRCLNLNGKNRPMMKEVAKELEAVLQISLEASNLHQNFEEVVLLKNEMLDPYYVSTSTIASMDSSIASSLDVEPLLSS